MNGGIYLEAGLCTDPGCAKGGNYKICCKDDRSGVVCPHPCSGANNSGTCSFGCYAPGLNVVSYPQSPPGVAQLLYRYQIKQQLAPLAKT